MSGPGGHAGVSEAVREGTARAESDLNRSFRADPSHQVPDWYGEQGDEPHTKVFQTLNA
jgi:hypothetical protein